MAEDSAAEAPAQSRLASALRALRHRNFRLFLTGQVVSQVGTWMQMVATGWLVWKLASTEYGPARAAYLLGIVGFAARLPSALIAPFAGVLVDRYNRHRIVIITQVLAMLQALVLALLTLAGVVEIWHVVLLNIGLGLVGAFDIPARQTFMIEMVDNRDDLGNAIALNSSVFNGARLVGPALAGWLTAMWGEGICFLANAISYIAVLWALLAMTLRPLPDDPDRPPVLRGIAEGFAYAAGSPAILALLLLVAVVSLMATPYMVLLPVYCETYLGGDATLFGLLTAASGGGALAGAIYLAARRSILGLGRVIPLASILFGTGLVALAWVSTPAAALALMAVIGAGMMVQMAATNTVLQAIVDDNKRGRVMSLYALAFMGTAPFGSLLAGWLAKRLGVLQTMELGGIAAILAGLVFLYSLERIREHVRPIYRAKGILPEVATGLAQADQATSFDEEPAD